MGENSILIENFDQKEVNKNLKWFSIPKEWHLNYENKTFVLKADANTDFWQKTHYDFQVDNGHFLYYEVSGDFRITTKVKSKPLNRYDQAGLMVRFSSRAWLKTSVEYIPDGKNKLGVVVTNHGYSDWSSQEFSSGETTLFYRITRRGNYYYVDYSLDASSWNQIRMTYLEEETEQMKVGIYACSPQGEGYIAEFDFINIERIDSKTEVYS